MRMEWTGEHGAKVVVEKPDEAMGKYMRDKVMDALYKEWTEFLQEMCVEIRRLKPGEKKLLLSKPIEITIESTVEDAAPTAATGN